MLRLTCSVLLLSLIVLAFAKGDEEMVPLDKLPRPVVDAVKKRFPTAELKHASKETENGKTEFEVTIKDGENKIDVTVSPEGALLSLEKQIDVKGLPKAVTAALEGKYPKATYKIAEEIIRVKEGKETLESYEVHLVTADKKELEVVVNAEGKILKTEEAEKDEKVEKKK